MSDTANAYAFKRPGALGLETLGYDFIAPRLVSSGPYQLGTRVQQRRFDRGAVPQGWTGQVTLAVPVLAEFGNLAAELPASAALASKTSARLNSLGMRAPTLSESFSSLLVDLSGEISPELSRKALELLELEANWDGEGAKPVRPQVFARILMLLGSIRRAHSSFLLPFVAPTFGGYLLLDWTSPVRNLEVEALARGWSVVGTLISKAGKKDYFQAEGDFGVGSILSYYEWFRDELLLWPTE
jgi:hypothetical protein